MMIYKLCRLGSETSFPRQIAYFDEFTIMAMEYNTASQEDQLIAYTISIQDAKIMSKKVISLPDKKQSLARLHHAIQYKKLAVETVSGVLYESRF